MSKYGSEHYPEENYLIPMHNILGCSTICKSLRDEKRDIIDFIIDYVNDAACESNHLTREEQIGKRLLQVLPSHKGNNLFDEYCKVVETGAPFYKENFSYKDIVHNNTLLVKVDIIAVKYKDGYAVTWRDKPQTQDLNDALQMSEESFKAAFENAAIGMAITGNDGRHLRVNNSLCEMTGYTENELLDKTFMDITYNEDLSASLNYFKQALDSRIKHYHLEKRYVHKNGSIIWVNLSASVVRDAKNGPLYITAQIQDITKIKQANEAIEYDKIKTEFFANLSHELRTPLNVILSSIQFSEFQIKKGSDISIDNMKKYVQMIKQNCLRLLRLVNNLIDVTKIDAGFNELKLQPADIISLIEAITVSVSEYAKGKGITVHFFTDIEEKVMSIDYDKIERIMLNLLSNAIKFTEANGSINVNIHDGGDSITLSVKDSGIGIPLEKQGIIFQRFGQVEQSLAKRHEGSGIGLSLVKSLVEMHGGKITVNSEIGVGSEFVIEFPVKQIADNIGFKVNKKITNNYVEKMNIEFSDIYIQR